MSYDLWLIPAGECPTPTAALAYGEAAIATTGADTAPLATQLAAAINAADDALDGDGVLSVKPITAQGDCVFVPSPFSLIHEARDLVLPLAFAAGFMVCDPQNGIVLDPRTSVPAAVTVNGDSRYPVVSPDLVDHVVSRLAVDDFVIVETAPEFYVQTQRLGPDSFALEYRAGSADEHYGTEVSSSAQVADAIHGWIAGDDASYRELTWEKLDLNFP